MTNSEKIKLYDHAIRCLATMHSGWHTSMTPSESAVVDAAMDAVMVDSDAMDALHSEWVIASPERRNELERVAPAAHEAKKYKSLVSRARRRAQTARQQSAA